MNAAFALGMTYPQSMRLIVLPQAFRAMVPLLLTQAIVLFQDTSLVYVISLADFFRTATNVGDRDGTTVEMVLFAGRVLFRDLRVCIGPRQKSSEKGRKMISIEKCFQVVRAVPGADRLHDGSQKG